jgi:hypothetical protein
MSYYRFTLPLPLCSTPAQAGTWHAFLEIDKRIFDREFKAAVLKTDGATRGIRYNFSAQAFSNLRMKASASQNSLQPGAQVTLSATLMEYGIPVTRRASVRAEVERPDNTRTTLSLTEVEPGLFQATMTAILHGVYRFRLVASGATMRGISFSREQLLSATAILGGDNPLPTSGPSTKAHDEQLCRLMECLLGPHAFGGFLSQNHVDPKGVRGCIEAWCKARLSGPSEQELKEHEGTTTPSK